MSLQVATRSRITIELHQAGVSPHLRGLRCLGSVDFVGPEILSLVDGDGRIYTLLLGRSSLVFLDAKRVMVCICSLTELTLHGSARAVSHIITLSQGLLRCTCI